MPCGSFVSLSKKFHIFMIDVRVLHGLQFGWIGRRVPIFARSSILTCWRRRASDMIVILRFPLIRAPEDSSTWP